MALVPVDSPSLCAHASLGRLAGQATALRGARRKASLAHFVDIESRRDCSATSTFM